ncbi:Rv2231c family pyridoxal phosphate-dependent protein CobC [Longispora albida]|uniref:Rv2231c family pyridoxal phosphate-dependent protein CobC n=1 Tax=Longispora albida TaxID=203523 RepID=UPI000373EBF3|nr:Rv2231c family pyridoxal phosphate-dependent protein CobC [Longispora albida]
MDPLRHHGDAELAPGLVDLAVNVRRAPHPPWLAGPIAGAMRELHLYPNATAATAAIAARHGRDPSEVLLTAGAAQAFTVLAQTLTPAHPTVIHPQFTEPEAAFRSAGHHVHRVVLEPPFTLDPSAIPGRADLIVIGNPTNPTSVLHPAADLRALARPGRTLIVDEAFADTIPGEPESLAGERVPGLVVIRSLTKTWGLAGLRIGYLLAEPDLVRRLADRLPLWPVSTPALAAAIACASPEALAAEREIATALAADRQFLADGLSAVGGIEVLPNHASSFVLVKTVGGLQLRDRLRKRGYVVRRADTFPGLGPDWLRIAVREPAVSRAFLEVLKDEVH